MTDFDFDAGAWTPERERLRADAAVSSKPRTMSELAASWRHRSEDLRVGAMLLRRHRFDDEAWAMERERYSLIRDAAAQERSARGVGDLTAWPEAGAAA